MPTGRLTPLAATAVVLAMLTSCSAAETVAGGSEPDSTTTAGDAADATATTGDDTATDDEEVPAEATTTTVSAEHGDTHAEDGDLEWDEREVVDVTLADDGTTVADVAGDAVAVDGSTVTVSAAGTYRLTGTLTDGEVVVDSADDGIVRLVLDGVDITSSTTSAIAVMDAGKAVVVLADGSDNVLVDAAEYTFADPTEDEPNATLFSKADLTIGGSGSLDVTANYNDAITSKDGLVIAGGTITIDAIDDGIRGKDYLVIGDADLTVDAGGDGLKADNDEDAALGWVEILGGTITISAGGDGVDAEADIVVRDGVLTITSGGGHTAQLGEDDSAKGLEGTTGVTIDGGTITIDAADDAVHSDGAITIADGALVLTTADDAVHADATLDVTGGSIEVTDSYEGLESAVITISGGTIDITASDDGINVAGGNDGSGQAGPGRGGPGGGRDAFAQESSGDYLLTIEGGTITVDADGDGLDANGSIVMTDGTVVVNGTTDNRNSALDYDRSFELSGGTLVAVGSAGMAQAPSESTQPVLAVSLASVQPAGTIVHLTSGNGDGDAAGEIVTFEPSKAYQSIVVSTPELVSGQSYDVWFGGTATGQDIGGLYLDGTYEGGTEAGAVTAS